MECRIISDKVTALKKTRKKLYTNIIWSEIEKYQIEEPVLSEKDKVRKPLRETEVDF